MSPLLVELLPQTFFWKDLKYVSTGKPAKLTAAAVKKAVTGAGRSWQLTSSTDDDPGLEFSSHRLGNQTSFKLSLRDDTWRKAGPKLASSLEKLSLQFFAALREHAVFRGDSGVYPDFYPELEYPHVDEVMDNPIFRYDLVVNVIDRRLPARLASGQKEAMSLMKKLCAATPPRGVRRLDDGDQTLLFWTSDLHEEGALGKAASAHERWLDKTFRSK